MKPLKKQTNIMKGGLLTACSVFIISLISSPVWSESVNDEYLWEKASEIVNKNSSFKPHRLVVTEVTKNKSGKTVETFKLVLVKNQQNGPFWKPLLMNDIPVEKADEEEHLKAFDGYIEKLETLHPFRKEDPDIQAEKTTVLRQYNGMPARVYSLKIRADDKFLMGEILLEEKNGVPLVMNLASAASFKEEGVTISNYKLSVFYNGESANWFPVRLTETMTLEAKTFPFMTWVGTHESKVLFEDFNQVKSGK